MLDFSEHGNSGGGGGEPSQHNQVLTAAIESAQMSIAVLGEIMQPCPRCFGLFLSATVFLDTFDKAPDGIFEEALDDFVKQVKRNHENRKQKGN